MADEQEPILTDKEKAEQYNVLADSYSRWSAALPVRGLRDMLGTVPEYESATQIERDMLALLFSMTKMMSWLLPRDDSEDKEPWEM